MPRPKQPDSRTLVAGFRVSPQEQQMLQAAADRQGLSISDLLRLTVLGKASGNKQQA
jgi:uncharacterized protein (DUF1778 family)